MKKFLKFIILITINGLFINNAFATNKIASKEISNFLSELKNNGPEKALDEVKIISEFSDDIYKKNGESTFSDQLRAKFSDKIKVKEYKEISSEKVFDANYRVIYNVQLSDGSSFQILFDLLEINGNFELSSGKIK